jgi:hypothetical protein
MGRLIFLLMVFMILALFSGIAAEDDFLSGGDTEGDTAVGTELDDDFLSGGDVEGDTADDPEIETTQVDTRTYIDDYTEYDEELETYVVDESSYTEVDSITSDTSITTSSGTIADYEMNNALFHLGELIQGSFVSFEANNALFWGSLFDATEFQANLDEGDSIEVAQLNSIGSLGKVYVEIDGGNLTQDEVIVFIPDGDDPTYIYYNSTEIEFQDGELYLLGESVTNNDITLETTTIEFDENGFTRVQLIPDNTYSFFDYSLFNSGEEDLIICKNDALCDINIVEAEFTINGKFELYEDEQLLVESLSEENEITIDFDAGTFEIDNRQARSGILCEVYTGNHILRETVDNTYEETNSETKPSTISFYTSILNDKDITITSDDTVSFFNYNAYDSEPSQSSSTLYAAPKVEQEKEPVSLGSMLGYGFILIGILILSLAFVMNVQRKQKKGQMTLFVAVGFVLLIILIIGVFVISANTDQSTNSLAVIESFGQATDAVEECVFDTVEDSVYALGEHGGYVVEKDSFSDFGTVYGVLTISAMEDSLASYLEREIAVCTEILEDTNFYIEENSRPSIIVSFGEQVTVTIESLGTVYMNGEIDSEYISEVEAELDINFALMHEQINSMYSSEYGIPIEFIEGYQIQTFVDSPTYSEKLLTMYDEENKFTLQVTKYLS